MNRLFQTFSVTAMVMLFITACGTWTFQAPPAEQTVSGSAGYKALLGKGLTDQEVANFLARNNCFHTGQFQVCKEAGMDLWIGSSQIVETVYFYLNNDAGYTAYKGELPFGLKFYDIQGAVEYKLKRMSVGNEGLPDESSSPDHFHYWAEYKEENMIIVYNSPYPDEDATIYAILVSN